MILPANPRLGVLAALRRSGWTDDRASQIVEFALAMPLLVLFVVGIFDFSTAISLKQKLTNAAREGARVAAADPANDLGTGKVPSSVADAFYVVDNYLLSENINDCGLSKGVDLPVQTGGTLTWVATTTTPPCGATSGLIVTINRGWITPVSATNVNTVNTRVTIQYPYTWRFGGVSGLVGGRFIGPTSITATATAYNEN